MLDILDEGEILSINSHEVGHYSKKHQLKFKILMMIQFIYYLIIAATILTGNELYYSFGYDRFSSALAIIVIVVVYDIFHRLFMLISNYISRRFECAADQYSASINGNGNLISALIKTYQFIHMSSHTHPIDEFVNYSHLDLYNRITAIQSGNNQSY